MATVLVLEDDEDNLLLLEAALEMSGYEVRLARSCAEAAAALAAGGVDAFVSDFSLADGNAVDLMKSLGDRRPRAAILLSGYGDAEARAASRDAGFAAHLQKPISPDELGKELRAALETAK